MVRNFWIMSQSHYAMKLRIFLSYKAYENCSVGQLLDIKNYNLVTEIHR